MASDRMNDNITGAGRGASLTPDEITNEIRRHEGYLILEAGAGTGKTHNLTERVIHQLVERKVPLEQILALTFTDFAAAEMRSRIYAAINRKMNGADHLQEARQHFSHNYISTFHSFCNRILQYFPDEVTEISVPDAPPVLDRTCNERAVDGGLELLSDYDEVLWMMEWRKQFYRKYKSHEGLGRQLSRLSVSDFEKFMKKLSGVDEQALGELALLDPEKFPVWLRRVSEPWRRERDALVRELLDELGAAPHWFTSPDHIPRSKEGLAAIQNKNGKLNRTKFSRKERDDEALAMLDEKAVALAGYEKALAALDEYLSRPGLAAEIASYPASEEFDPEHEAYWNMRDLAELGLRWGTLMRYQRFEAGYFNYDDMIWLTHRLFTGNPAVVAQMRSRFKQILVDEFQDTDRRQWEILCKLAFSDGIGGKGSGQDTGASGGDKEVLVVGDVKQAIYGFRGGDVAMMRRVENELEQRSGKSAGTPGGVSGDVSDGSSGAASDAASGRNPGVSGSHPLLRRPLPYSFRSNAAVITFANELFRDVFGPEAQVASYEAHHQPLGSPPGDMARNAGAPGEIRVLRVDGKALGEELKQRAAQAGTGSTHPSEEAIQLTSYPVHLEARNIARFLRDIYDGRREGYDAIRRKMRNGEKAVGVLYRRRKHMYALEDALREAGLPYTVAKGTSYYMRREVRDAWLLLSFLLDAHDDISLVGLLRSPMVSFSDSGLLAVRVVMDERQHDYANFWSAVSDHKTWGDRLSAADRMALESGVPLLERLREKVPFRRVSELLEEAFFTSGPYLGGIPDDPQVRENLVKLLDVVRNLESSGRGTLFEVTGFLSNRIQEEAADSEAEHAEPAPVQLMTIHGSKGLEFPMVVLPDMYAGDSHGGVQLYLADDDPDSFLWPALAYKPGDAESEKDAEASFLYRILKAERTKRQLAEIKRLFYVAVTRAETHVLLSLVRPERAKSGSFAELLEPWLADREGDAEQNVISIEDLTPEGVEELVSGRLKSADDPGEAVAVQGEAVVDSEKFRIPDRSSPGFVRADAMVSAEIRSASGKAPVRTGIEEDGGRGISDGIEEEEEADALVDAARPQWTGMSPADAGTLVHRTLEMGLDIGADTDAGHSGVGYDDEARAGGTAASTRELESFWKRELFRMDVADPGQVVAENGEELLRHCRNARNWIRDRFGEDAPVRFEVSFEVGVPISRLNGNENGNGDEDENGKGYGDGNGNVNVNENEDGAKAEDAPEKFVTMRGSIDMVIRDREGQWHIVDFKTGPVAGVQSGLVSGAETGLATGADAERAAGVQMGAGRAADDAVVRHARAAGYDRQIRNYLIAWDQLHGPVHKMDPARVWLLFTAPETARAVSLVDF